MESHFQGEIEEKFFPPKMCFHTLRGGGGVQEVWKKSTLFIFFFFEGFPKAQTGEKQQLCVKRYYYETQGRHPYYEIKWMFLDSKEDTFAQCIILHFLIDDYLL